MAYSLMGIFDVSMPLLYGEGEKAFIRLQHEIIKITDDESIFAWTDHDLAKSGMFAKSPKAFAGSRDVVRIMDGDPLYVRRTPYAVTNRGFATEVFTRESVGGKAEAVWTVASFRDSFVPINCGRQSESPADPVQQVVIELDHVSRDDFVRSSPGQLRPPMCHASNMFSPGQLRPPIITSLAYVLPVYKFKSLHQRKSFFLDTSSLWNRGLSILDTYNCQLEKNLWDPLKRKELRRFTLGRGQSIAAVLLNGSRDGNRQRFGIIFHAAEDTPSINLMAPSTAERFETEMTDYKYGPMNPFPSEPSVGPISLMLQDNRWVSIKLAGQGSTPFEERYFVGFERPCEEDRVYI